MTRTLGNIMGSGNKVYRQDHIRLKNIRSISTILLGVIAFLYTSNVMALPSGLLVPISQSKEVKSDIANSLNTTLTLSLASKVQLADDNQMAASLKAARCKGAKCKSVVMKLAESAKVRFVFVPSLVNEFDIYTLKFTAIDTDYPKRASVSLETSCEFCSIDDLKAKFRSMVTSKDMVVALSKPGKPKGPTSFTLSVITSPSNAEIFIDGQSKGRTPLSIANLKAKAHKVSVKLKGYHTQTRTVTPSNPLPMSPISESFTLKPKAPTSFPIIIKTKPKGASVVLDGVKIKVKTPFKAKVKPGAHEITFSLKGYEEFKQTFNTPTQSETVFVNVTLKKIQVAQPKKESPQTVKTAPKVISTPVIPPRPKLLASNWSGAALGVGTIMTGVGAWLLTIHGEITCNDGRTRKTCPDIYNTKIPAGMLLGMGTAAVGASLVTLLIRSEWPAPKARMKSQVKSLSVLPQIMPTHGGAAASWQVDF